uniref:Uncharacterized protein n=1 Tax=Arabidopsis thaliana TaxID=3702 RepID=Q0WLU5_ARATH|nr:hypothetical protein [Arabidopsis thaliana]
MIHRYSEYMEEPVLINRESNHQQSDSLKNQSFSILHEVRDIKVCSFHTQDQSNSRVKHNLVL